MSCDECGEREGKMVAMEGWRDVSYGEWGHSIKNEYIEYALCLECFIKELVKKKKEMSKDNKFTKTIEELRGNE